LREAIEQFAMPESDRLALIVTAVSSMFADVVAGAAAAPALVEVINKRIELAGFRIVETRRN
jgi:hypothetical protein